MTLAPCLAAFVTFAASVPRDGPSAADVITLRDGTEILGQVWAEIAPTRGGGLMVVVRRVWAHENAPEWADRWEAEEIPVVRRARKDRADRLALWRHEREEGVEADDPILRWIDREVIRLRDAKAPETALMTATIPRADIRSVDRRDPETARFLRLAWLAGMGRPEEAPLDQVKKSLRARPVARGDVYASVELLLPTPIETDGRWRIRRAATEAAVDPSQRFVHFREFLLPEDDTGKDDPPADRLDLVDTPAAREGFAAINGIKPGDVVAERLDDLADDGAVGAVVTAVSLNVESPVAEATATFRVLRDDGHWSIIATRSAKSRTDDPPAPDSPAAEGTPIRTALLVLELVSNAPSNAEITEERQEAGKAASRAFAKARADLDVVLTNLSLPVDAAPVPQRNGAPR